MLRFNILLLSKININVERIDIKGFNFRELKRFNISKIFVLLYRKILRVNIYYSIKITNNFNRNFIFLIIRSCDLLSFIFFSKI